MNGKAIEYGSLTTRILQWLEFAIVLAGIGVAVLVFIPLQPSYPSAGLDASWAYALNEAAARHMAFGSDIVFTFGPLASVYSGMYHPETDWIMLFGNVLVASAVSLGCALLALPRKLIYVPVLPFLVAVISRDCIFIVLPFILLLLILRVYGDVDSEHHLRPTRLALAGVALITCAVAVLPLIKGSFAVSALFSGGLSLIILLRHRRFAAGLFTCVAIGSVCGSWIAIGQPIGALIAYFARQGPIISGYSEAMSFEGAPLEVAVYIVVSIVLLGVFYKDFAMRFRGAGLIAVASFAITFFVCFKAAFVRHDGHALIGAGALLFGGFLVSTIARPVRSIVVLVLVISSWAYIDRAYTGLDMAKVCQRVNSAIASAYNGIKVRVLAPEQLPANFERQNAAIRAQVPLPPVVGTVDLYPYDLSTVFAHGLRWSPRPVIQSYSAYDSRLDALNAAHLEGPNAPQNVFFQVASIDDRFPPLDDAGSWLELLSGYQIVGYDAGDIHLKRLDGGRSKRALGPEVARITARVGSPVKMPSHDYPLWAEIDLNPTFLGRLGLSLFKIPPIQLTLALKDGRIMHHRYIPAMGRNGFLLSPYINSTDDFGLLAAGEIPEANEVMWIQVDTPRIKMWNRRFTVRLRRLELDAQSSARAIFLIQPSEPPSSLARAVKASDSQCQIDFINGMPAKAADDLMSPQKMLKLEGWSIVSSKDAIAPDEVWIALESLDGKSLYYQVKIEPRPDVKAYLKHQNMKDPGFVANLDLTGVLGKQKIHIYGMAGGTAFEYAENRTINVGSPARSVGVVK